MLRISPGGAFSWAPSASGSLVCKAVSKPDFRHSRSLGKRRPFRCPAGAGSPGLLGDLMHSLGTASAII